VRILSGAYIERVSFSASVDAFALASITRVELCCTSILLKTNLGLQPVREP
jgi:hypothetical protein